MKAFFFGSSRRRLYGVYHAPHAAAARNAAVLLCYPGVQEYNATHWAFRKLAAMLARAGFHVMRFDWYGTGDSSGDVQDASTADWIDDVGVAARELTDVSAARSLSIVGMRLGAALGALACTAGMSLRHLVLWEPVVVGGRYVDELERLDATENFRLLHRDRRGKEQLVGYAFPSAMRRAIADIDLRLMRFDHAQRVSMFVSSERAEYRDLREGLSSANVAVSYLQVLDDTPGAGALESALLSNDVLVAMTDHLGHTRVIEKVLSVGPDGILTGVLAEPAPGRAIPGAPAVVMWNVGINHHVGPYRINVELARRLAERGFCALRLDISGMGDSEVRRGGPATIDRAVDDVREAMDFLERRRGIRTFVLIGFCSSVDAAHTLALVEERVVGNAYLEGYAYRTRGFWMRYPLRLLSRARWERYLARRLPRFFSGPSRTTAVDPNEAERAGRGTIYVRDVPRPEKFAADVKQMVRRGVRLLFVYVGGDTDYNHVGQLREVVGRGREAPRLEVEFMPDADHTFFLLEDRARVVDVTCRWIESNFGHAPSGLPLDAKRT